MQEPTSPELALATSDPSPQAKSTSSTQQHINTVPSTGVSPEEYFDSQQTQLDEDKETTNTEPTAILEHSSIRHNTQSLFRARIASRTKEKANLPNDASSSQIDDNTCKSAANSQTSLKESDVFFEALVEVSDSECVPMDVQLDIEETMIDSSLAHRDSQATDSQSLLQTQIKTALGNGFPVHTDSTGLPYCDEVDMGDSDDNLFDDEMLDISSFDELEDCETESDFENDLKASTSGAVSSIQALGSISTQTTYHSKNEQLPCNSEPNSATSIHPNTGQISEFDELEHYQDVSSYSYKDTQATKRVKASLESAGDTRVSFRDANEIDIALGSAHEYPHSPHCNSQACDGGVCELEVSPSTSDYEWNDVVATTTVTTNTQVEKDKLCCPQDDLCCGQNVDGSIYCIADDGNKLSTCKEKLSYHPYHCRSYKDPFDYISDHCNTEETCKANIGASITCVDIDTTSDGALGERSSERTGHPTVDSQVNSVTEDDFNWDCTDLT